MTADPRSRRPPAGHVGETLEDRVYRPTLGEGNPELTGASPWRTLPVTAGVLLLFGGLAAFLGHAGGAGDAVLPSVGLVLQEGVDRPAGNAGGGSPPPAPAPAPTPAPAPAPPAAVPPGPPPEPPSSAAPQAAPLDLPRDDHARETGASGGASAGAGTGTGSGAGPGSGSGPGGLGTGGEDDGPGWSMTIEASKVEYTYRPPPPPYPRLAQMARIQGTVNVQVQVGADGVPVSAKALDGPYQLRAAAEAYALTWRLKAPTVNGVPRPFQFDLKVIFHVN